MGLLFKKAGQEAKHLKEWVVIFFHLFLPVLFGVWGLILSIAANKNREQIDALTTVVTELKNQNTQLQTLIAIQDSLFRAYMNEVKNSRKPILRAELFGGDLGEVANIDAKITNSGGDIFNVIITPLNGTMIDLSRLPKTKTLTTGSEFILRINNLRNGKAVRITYNDALMNKYSQDLVWQSNNEYLQFSSMREISK